MRPHRGDPDGTIVSYEWSFGDGNTGTGVSGLYNFVSEGAYSVTLTVTDNEGATDTATTAVLVTSPGNQLPVASFTADPSLGFAPFDVDFDASASYDPDGIIAMYSWDFGDG
ncbi:MAG: PKD domain-containing protein, partial [Thermoanaerobaculales bacterium]|nr:PKD domain-containing protein [Thermoanaerobaculales bacterium]